jgi:hypothetical protein
MQKARFIVENKIQHKHTFLVIFCLESFNKWYIQLWGEIILKDKLQAK